MSTRIRGEAVRQLRTMCLFTREGLAMHAALEGGAAAVAAIERGEMQPDASVLAALARALGVDAEALCAGDDEGGG